MSARIMTSISGAKAGNTVHTFTNSDPTKPMKLLYGHVILTTNATVASRLVSLSVKDADGNVLIDIHPGASVAASQTNQHFSFMQGVYRETSFISASLQVPIPIDCIAPAGGSFEISVDAGVAGDSYEAHLVVEGM